MGTKKITSIIEEFM